MFNKYPFNGFIFNRLADRCIGLISNTEAYRRLTHKTDAYRKLKGDAEPYRRLHVTLKNSEEILMNVYYKGSTPYIEVEVRNRSTDALVNASTSVTCTIYDPVGTVAANAAMSNDSTGIYHYAGATVTADWVSGTYRYVILVTDGSVVSPASGEFEVNTEC